MAYISYNGGVKSLASHREVDLIVAWGILHVSAQSGVHIPGVEKWQADFPSQQHLDSGQCSLHPEGFQDLAVENDRHGPPGIQVQQETKQLCLQVQGSSLAMSGDALVTLWDHLIFLPLKLLPHDLSEGHSGDIYHTKLAQADMVLKPCQPPGRSPGFFFSCPSDWFTGPAVKAPGHKSQVLRFSYVKSTLPKIYHHT